MHVHLLERKQHMSPKLNLHVRSLSFLLSHSLMTCTLPFPPTFVHQCPPIKNSPNTPPPKIKIPPKYSRILFFDVTLSLSLSLWVELKCSTPIMVGVAVARVIHCELQAQKPPQQPKVGAESSTGPDQVKVVLQPRLCTLRSYAPDRGGVIRTVPRSSPKVEGGVDGAAAAEEPQLSPFLENLYEYIESTKKSQDFEILTGRLAMMVFAATIGVELATGNSVFKKMDLQGIAQGIGACLVAVACAAGFAYSSSARKRVGRIFSISCNAFIDALIDNIVDSLFYDSELDDRSDDKIEL